VSTFQPGVVFALLAATIPLVALANRAKIPYPVALVLGGLVLGFVPGLPQVTFDPNLVLVLFLPPLLYWESITAPTDAMRANAGQIWLLALGLVVATTVAIAVVAHALIPNLSWPVAFILGAIVAPTDELASAPVLERLRMPRHLVATVEGESLLNDASSLVIYGAAVTAALTGTFSVGHTLLGFLWAAAGAFALGLAAGQLAIVGWRLIRDSDLQNAISFALPFVTYGVAQRFGLSGVLAVVTAGIYVNRVTPIVVTPVARLQAVGYWSTFVFLANALLFLLVGLQLHGLAQTVFREFSWQAVLWYAFVVNAVVIVVRFSWIMVQEYSPVIGGTVEHEQGDWRHALIASWSGLRGAVSLAAALAIPISIGSGYLHRDLVIFLTFSVIVVTLVGGGLTLPFVIRALRVPGDTIGSAELTRALNVTVQAALRRIDELRREERIDAGQAAALRRRYEHRRRDIESIAGDDTRDHVRREVDAEWAVLQAERQALIELRADRQIDNTILRQLQRGLDLQQARLEAMADGIQVDED
jgi:monovalent cation/hydrogen antiporter